MNLGASSERQRAQLLIYVSSYCLLPRQTASQAHNRRSFAGLINQLYSHIAAIMLARAIGAELVLAPAIHRDSFNSHMTKTTWHAAPQESLIDVDAVKQYWRGKGMLIHTVRNPMSTARMLVQPALRAVPWNIKPHWRASVAAWTAHYCFPHLSPPGSILCCMFVGPPAWSQSVLIALTDLAESSVFPRPLRRLTACLVRALPLTRTACPSIPLALDLAHAAWIATPPPAREIWQALLIYLWCKMSFAFKSDQTQ